MPRHLLEQLITIRHDVKHEAAQRMNQWREYITPERHQFVHSAENLAWYLALRRRDLRDIQHELRPWGLSSLGRIEAQVAANLDAVIATVAQLSNSPIEHPRPTVHQFREGEQRLDHATDEVLGKATPNRRVRMMVTLPSEASDDYLMIKQMLEHGMNVARINCAHDGIVEWQRMIEHVRRAEKDTGTPCKIAMDLGGPKSRTADIIQPKKNRLHIGDEVLVTADVPQPNERFEMQVRCTLKEALEQVQVGAQVWFDDGIIGTQVIARLPEGILLRVTTASAEGNKLKEDKGINFPDTALNLVPLTEKDIQDLDFIVAHADMVNYSFVQSADDVRLIQAEIAKRNPQKRPIALIAKIETAKAIQNLAEIIVTAAGVQPMGVMIARGDLAVEIGFERLAEMQEEILWICEAAHIPVIWATQVLETLAKEGRPSRAEITDAAMGERAECVMLNKGAYILEAMSILDGVLRRMQTHQTKKVSQLRALQSF